MKTTKKDNNLDWLGVTDSEADGAEKENYSVFAHDGQGWFTALVTTEHPTSSYNLPVLVHIRTGIAYGTGEVTIRLRSNIHAYNYAKSAGYLDCTLDC